MSREADPARTWDAYRVPQMWDMVKDEDPVPTYQQVGAWQKMAALCTDTAGAVQKALDQLMAKWPPNPGSAAEVFKKQVDFLIWSMRDSAAAATATWPAVIEIVMALSQAKDAVGVLMEKHSAYEKAEDDGVVPNPPIGWRDTLDAQARRIMTVADVQVGQAATQIKAPTVYPGLSLGQINDGTDVGGSTGGTNRGAAAARRPVPFPETDPPTRGVAARPAPGDGSGADNLVLDGQQLKLTGPVVSERANNAMPFVLTPVGVALAPGGVIGSPNHSSPDAATQAGAEAGNGRAGANTGMSGALAPPMLGRTATATGGNRVAVTSGGRRRRRSDPDDPWSLPVGVPPVLEPAPEPDYFDPGPNVFGLDR